MRTTAVAAATRQNTADIVVDDEDDLPLEFENATFEVEVAKSVLSSPVSSSLVSSSSASYPSSSSSSPSFSSAPYSSSSSTPSSSSSLSVRPLQQFRQNTADSTAQNTADIDADDEDDLPLEFENATFEVELAASQDKSLPASVSNTPSINENNEAEEDLDVSILNLEFEVQIAERTVSPERTEKENEASSLVLEKA